jgi:guanine deaminase
VKNNDFILKGDICWSKSLRSLKTGSYLVCLNGKSAGVFDKPPEQYAGFSIIDYSGRLIIPGLTDLHMHAPQFAFRGLGMDLELLDWLNCHAFPEEAKYGDIEYARYAYGLLVEHLKRGPNTRIIIFATIHTPATLLLMDLLEESGLVCLVGKVNMDRNSPDYLREDSAAASLTATREWLGACFSPDRDRGGSKNVLPILTPRFIPTCSDELMRGLAGIQKEFGLPLQSHLSENRKEVQWVKELYPAAAGYGAAYADFGLFGPSTVMAHCVWSDKRETELLAERGVFIAHCPQSNTNLSSGIAPLRRFLDSGCNAGLGSDVAGGAHTSIFRAMSDAIQVSKLRRILLAETTKPIGLEEAFYLGTAGGGAFFTKAARSSERAENGGSADSPAGRSENNSADFPGASGSFEPGYDFDALVIDDGELACPSPLSIRDRLERVVYLSDDRHIQAKYVRGLEIKTISPAEQSQMHQNLKTPYR